MLSRACFFGEMGKGKIRLVLSHPNNGPRKISEKEDNLKKLKRREIENASVIAINVIN